MCLCLCGLYRYVQGHQGAIEKPFPFRFQICVLSFYLKYLRGIGEPYWPLKFLFSELCWSPTFQSQTSSSIRHLICQTQKVRYELNTYISVQPTLLPVFVICVNGNSTLPVVTVRNLSHPLRLCIQRKPPSSLEFYLLNISCRHPILFASIPILAPCLSRSFLMVFCSSNLF